MQATHILIVRYSTGERRQDNCEYLISMNACIYFFKIYNIMGFLGSLISSAVKVVVSPIAIVSDIANGGETSNTAEILGSAVEDAADSVDSLIEGDIL